MMSEEIMDSVLQNLRSLAGPPRGGTQRAPCYMNLEFHRCLFPQGEWARRRLKCEAGVHTHKLTHINMYPPLIFNDQNEKEESLGKEHEKTRTSSSSPTGTAAVLSFIPPCSSS